jgi:tubulin polyglutamylase TTLL6/13
MAEPHLIDGLKYDLRIYVIVVGISPLRVYVSKEGLARFATEEYEKPSERNLDNHFMHLTNYAINKDHEDFVQNENADEDDVGSKRSLRSIIEHIENEESEKVAAELMDKIYDIITKSLCIAQCHISHLVKTFQPEDIENQQCFQILGYDVMLDDCLNPYLVEINQMPSFQTDSPLDYKLKKKMISDCLKILCLQVDRKKEYKEERKAKIQQHLLKPTRAKINEVVGKMDQS